MDQDYEVCIESSWRAGGEAVNGDTDDSRSHLTNAVRVAHTVLAEHDLTLPYECTLLAIVEAALDARALLARASIQWPSPIRLQLLLEALILFCAQADFEEEEL
jgi:hypothetical protein